MKRALAVLASASFIVAIGCKDYDIRLEKTLEERKYEKRLNENLEAAPTKGMLQGDSIFVRPPLGLEGPTQAFGLTGVEAGRFDIENSFIDQKKGASLHVVARVKKPKAPPSGKKAAAPVETVVRGKFLDDVVELVKSAYSIELAAGEAQKRVKESWKPRKQLQGRDERSFDQGSGGLRLLRVERCSRSGPDLRIPQGPEELHQSQDRPLSGKPRGKQARRPIFRRGDVPGRRRWRRDGHTCRSTAADLTRG